MIFLHFTYLATFCSAPI